jgi:hypothetical protein
MDYIDITPLLPWVQDMFKGARVHITGTSGRRFIKFYDECGHHLGNIVESHYDHDQVYWTHVHFTYTNFLDATTALLTRAQESTAPRGWEFV